MDVIIGAITHYNIPQLQPYVKSLNQSGFKGDRYMVCYDVSFDVVKYLEENGFKVIVFERNDAEQRFFFKRSTTFNICVERFYHMWLFLSQLSPQVQKTYRYLISLDVGDVVFQSDPSAYLDHLYEEELKNKTGIRLFATTESVLYRDEIYWGRDNMIRSFGKGVYESIKDRLIVNTGTLCGEFSVVKDLMLLIYQMCQGYGTPNPDQAAYNLILSLEPYRSICRVLKSEEGFACELGTTLSATKKFLLQEPKPIFNQRDKMITTSTGRPFSIVHQYNYAGLTASNLGF